MHNQPEIRYSESLNEQKWQNSRDLVTYLFAYLEHLADIQAGITLTVDRLMVIPYDYQIASPSRRTCDEVAVKPGTYRLRAFRENRGQRDECHRVFDFDRRFVLDMYRTGILGNPIPYEVWFRNSQCLAHILKEHFTGSVEIVEDRRFPGTVRKITFTHSNAAENRTGGSNNEN